MSSQPEMKRVTVLDSYLAYRETGASATDTVVFLHGNPTSSYLWRNVLPIVATKARCVAPDLIGMGQSGKPNSEYRFADHARYLDAYFDAMDLREVVVVGLDWGGVLAIDWAARHADRVRGVVVLETFLQPMRWSDFPPQGAELFRALRTPIGNPLRTSARKAPAAGSACVRRLAERLSLIGSARRSLPP